MRTLAAAALAAALSSPALAKPKLSTTLSGASPKPEMTAPSPADAEADRAAEATLRLQVEADYEGTHRSADFLVKNAVQANYVEGGETGVEVDDGKKKGVEYKKTGFIVNVLPVGDPNDPKMVDLQLQVEVTGPAKRAAGLEVTTWQYQSEFRVEKGRLTTIARGSARLTVRVSDSTGD